MNILVLAGNIPATSGMPGCPRLFNFCRELSKDHEISLIAVCHSQERRDTFLGDPAAKGVFKEITYLPAAASPSWWGKQKHRLRLAPHFVTKYQHPQYYQDIRRTIGKTISLNPSPDLLYVAGLYMTEYVGAHSRIPAIVDLGDSKTLLFTRTTMMEKRVLRKLLLTLETWSISRWEKSLGNVFRLVVMTSKADELFMKTLDPSAPTLAISNGVDSEYFSPAKEPVSPGRLVFTGVMSYGPNEDAVLYFCREILPLIKKDWPSVEFWVVGQNPTPRVQALSQICDVHVTGRVEDVRPYAHSAGVFVSPLRYGAGIKNKILAAMAMKKPVVASSLSLDEIEAKAGREALVADTPADFAAKVARVLNNEDLRRRLGENGRKLVVEKYSWKARAELLEAAVRRVVTTKNAFVDHKMRQGSELQDPISSAGAFQKRRD